MYCCPNILRNFEGHFFNLISRASEQSSRQTPTTNSCVELCPKDEGMQSAYVITPFSVTGGLPGVLYAQPSGA